MDRARYRGRTYRLVYRQVSEIIEGTEYKFANGRVFLVSTEGDKISVRQLDIPISDATYDAEIDRIAELEEVQEFLSK
jgi:DNA polymerase III sliding clamp (beta) subunit (PCNA family)